MMDSMPRRSMTGWEWLLPLVAVLVLWQAAAWLSPPAILPGPLETLRALARLASRTDFYRQLTTTAWRGVVGFGVAMALGIGLGLWMGRREQAYRFFHPLLLLATNVPPIAWIALLLIWLGLGDGPPLVVVVITTTPLVAVSVAQGVRELDPTLLEMAHVFGLGRGHTLRHIVLPALAGRTFASALLALGFTWRVLVMAEFLGSTAGLGYRLSWARQNLDTDQAFAYILVIVALSAVIEYGLLRPLQRRWQWEPGRHPGERTAPHYHAGKIHTHPPLPDLLVEEEG
jgi:NitT/TauT family transport system permease protein